MANLKNMTSFEFDSPIDVRSAAFSSDNQYLFINSVQLGTVTRDHLASRKVDAPVKLQTMGNLLAVPPHNYLYYFHEKGHLS